jgi:molybdenum cofactor biosynthesis enzyme MoaA
MDCRILRHVTLKSDGHFGCDDSVGYHTDLGHVEQASGWSLRDIFNKPIYRHIRSSFKAGNVPWPGTCEGCDLFSAAAEPVDTLDTRIELLVEPTLECNLGCACCIRKQILSNGRNTSSMDPAILTRFMRSCQADAIEIEQIHYIGWGEPLKHESFRDLFEIAKAHAPLAHQVVTTAANVDFRSTVGDAAMDRIVASVDGSSQASYEKYRRGGDLEQAIRFMRDAKIYGHRDVFLEWKYILFEHNDTDEDILLAQDIADDIGVDSLLFIITNSKWNSQRFTVDSSETIPIRSQIASVSPAAAMTSIAFDGRISASPASVLGHIDRCTISIGRFLTVEGWALDAASCGPAVVELLVDGVVRARSRTTLRREDVIAAHPRSAGGRSGFMFRVPVDVMNLPSRIEIRVSGTANMMGGKVTWLSAAHGVKRRADLPKLPAI